MNYNGNGIEFILDSSKLAEITAFIDKLNSEASNIKVNKENLDSVMSQDALIEFFEETDSGSAIRNEIIRLDTLVDEAKVTLESLIGRINVFIQNQSQTNSSNTMN